MIIKQLIDEDFANYKKASMFIGFPSCTFKCEKDSNFPGMCQNCDIVKSPDHDVTIEYLTNRYINNDITSAIVCGGLEPFDSFDDLYGFIKYLRRHHKCDDDIVIYTGYYKSEILDKLILLSKYSNIIIKYGRFIPNQSFHFDEILGVNLSSDNQYAEKLFPLKYKVIKNPDLSKDDINNILNKIKENDGYCPCRLVRDNDSLCMCKEFKDLINSKTLCECHCGLYKFTLV